ncbi:response regulator [Niallia oryzisoli]|uniref:GGDEF domain-containing response regulator n=1 Tax=Niallia oryzisoli TaxID=1737571 RepID=UPI003734F871
MEKYQKLLLKNIRSQLEKWMEQKKDIPHHEVYRFLHSISGTAGTIGMIEIMKIAKELMVQLNEQAAKLWTLKEIQEFMIQLIYLSYNQTLELTHEDKAEKQVKEGQPFILVIDDETSMLMYIKEELEKSGNVVMVAADPVKAISSFYDMRPDCIILDIHMKGKNGFELLTFLKEKLKQLFVPTIMISVDNSIENRVKTFEMGADDFIAKPFDMEELRARVKRHIEKKRLVDNLILTDELTRVYNRKYMKHAFDTMCSILLNRQEPFCLAMLDLDHFKVVNDCFGHLMGDHVIQTFAAFLQEKSSKDDIVIRFGGEEFLLLMQGVSAAEGKEFLEQLIVKFQNQTFYTKTDSFSCSFSAGIVEVNTANDDIEKWLSLADEALYRAKEAGRRQVYMNESDIEICYKKPLRVAVIDDDPIMCTILEEMLVRFSNELPFQLNVKSFLNGTLFLSDEWTYSNEPYLVLLDGIMPEIDGLEVLQSLRESTRQDQYTVFMLTSRNSQKDIAKALELGADDYLTKPFKMAELQKRIRYLCTRMK